MSGPKSAALFRDAQQLMPGGVSSPVRAFRAVGGEPLFIAKGHGAWITDVDGRRYVDYMMSWGPLALGHAAPDVVRAIERVAQDGTSFGAPSPLEVDLARLVQRAVPSMEMMRFVSSGTEATMSALRVARAFTQRARIIKFEGCYHGHGDMLLVQAGSGVATLGLPDSPGVTPGTVADTLVARYNDLADVERLLTEHASRVAAIIVEPVVGNMGVVAPHAEFLPGLRALATKHGALLIFDEVMTGFRVHPGGAQALYGVTPDLTTLGKVIGGGLPVGAYGGRRDIMSLVAPAGPVYQAGTLSGNPLAMAAGIATLTALGKSGVWQRMADATASLAAIFRDAAKAARVTVQVPYVGGMITVFFNGKPVTDWPSAKASDTAAFGRFFRALLEHGVYWVPSQFEAAFPSAAHGAEELAATKKAATAAFAAAAKDS